MSDIFFWSRHGEYGFLSNFWRAPIKVDSVRYPTTEHYYQAGKTLIPEEQNMIRTLRWPGEAKSAGYHVTLWEGWEKAKEDIMLTALRAKFTQHLTLKRKLLDTEDEVLHEDSPWDKYWGYAGGKGKDRLGVLLMKIREELRSEANNH